MKKIFYLLLAGIIVALASCSKSDDADNIELTNGRTTFTLTMEDSIPSVQTKATRATSTVTPTRYIMEVWSEDGTQAENVFENGNTNHAEATTGSFTVTLDKTKAYTCLFWADDNGITYDATQLKAIGIKAGQEVTEAYHSKIFVVKDKTPTINVSLKRAVAKVTLEESATLEAGKTLTATYKQLPEFNVLAGKAVGTATSKTYTTTLAEDKLTGKYTEFYLLGNSEQSPTDFSFVYNGEPAKTVTNVPIQQNYITNIKGEYSSLANFTFEVEADDAWGTPDNDVTAKTSIRISDTPGANGAPVYEIYDADGLKAFMGLINGTETAYEINGIKIPTTPTEEQRKSNIILQTDIDLSELCGPDKGNWKPIGTSYDKSFTGTFDGNGKTIQNLYINEKTDRSSEAVEYRTNLYGLIGASRNAIIKNLTVTGSITVDNKGYTDYIAAAGVVAYLYEGGTATNCHSSIAINVKLTNSSSSQGGMTVGGVAASSHSSLIEQSTSTSAIVAEFYAPAGIYALTCQVGGVIGSIYEGDIKNCHYSLGSIKAYSDNYECTVGGVSGNLRGGEMFGCSNSSPLEAKTERWGSKIGGVCGYSDLSAKLAACYNTGDLTISAGTKEYSVGGILSNAYRISLIGCYSSGNIINNVPSATYSYQGGIAGKFSYSQNSGFANQCWYVGNSDWGTDGMGDPSYTSTAITNCGRVADIATLSSKVSGMNTALKAYNDTTAVDKKCLFSFVNNGSRLPTLQKAAAN